MTLLVEPKLVSGVTGDSSQGHMNLRFLIKLFVKGINLGPWLCVIDE